MEQSKITSKIITKVIVALYLVILTVLFIIGALSPNYPVRQAFFYLLVLFIFGSVVYAYVRRNKERKERTAKIREAVATNPEEMRLLNRLLMIIPIISTVFFLIETLMGTNVIFYLGGPAFLLIFVGLLIWGAYDSPKIVEHLRTRKVLRVMMIVCFSFLFALAFIYAEKIFFALVGIVLSSGTSWGPWDWLGFVLVMTPVIFIYYQVIRFPRASKKDSGVITD